MGLTLFEEAVTAHKLNTVRDFITGKVGEVCFVAGDGEKRFSKILKVWSTQKNFPLLNLEDDLGQVHTSVPHYSAVPGAKGFYYEICESLEKIG